MAQVKPFQTALEKVRKVINSTANARIDSLVALADVEVRAEQARQQELANLIAMLATPAACPFPSVVVTARIKELAGLEN